LVDNEKYYDILGCDGESSGFITSKGEIALPGDRSKHKYLFTSIYDKHVATH